MMRNFIAFFVALLALSSPVNLVVGILEGAKTPVHKFYSPIREMEIAENHFNFCDPEYIPAAIFEMNAAECKMRAFQKEVMAV